MKNELKTTLVQLNEWMKQNTVKEIVSDETACMAMDIINNTKIKSVDDAFVFASALNVMNTFVKQKPENKEKYGYGFKDGACSIAQYLVNNPSEDLKLEIQTDKGMSLGIFVIYGIQFSFHKVSTMVEEFKQFIAKDNENPQIPWDGVRKQMSANTLFNFAIAEFGRGE